MPDSPSTLDTVEAALQMPKALWGLDPRVVQQIPAVVAWEYRVIPVRREGVRLVLLSGRNLDDDDIRTIRFLLDHDEVEFVVDANAYPEVRNHLSELLEYYYPPEKAGFLSSADGGRGG